MRLAIGIILIALLSGFAELFLPWWSVAIVAFVVALLAGQGSGRSFLMGFLGVGLFWLIAASIHDFTNEHILSARMATLLHLPGYVFFVAVTVLIGGLVGGFAAMGGGMMRQPSNS